MYLGQLQWPCLVGVLFFPSEFKIVYYHFGEKKMKRKDGGEKNLYVNLSKENKIGHKVQLLYTLFYSEKKMSWELNI